MGLGFWKGRVLDFWGLRAQDTEVHKALYSWEKRLD